MNISEELSKLFSGLTRAYGTFKIAKSRDRDGKQLGKVTSVQKPVTPLIWENHYKGVEAIGIVPIREDNMCTFGCIDIDDYTLTEKDYKNLCTKIESLGFPLVPTTTKSGGIHAWLFMQEPVAASLMQSKLRDMASAMGVGKSEIFPKQTEVLSDRGDIGNWINMPYFGGMAGKRHGINLDGKPIEAELFIEIANLKKCSVEQLEKIKSKQSEELPNGPPCLQHLVTQGLPQGTRNSGLYNLGVYAKKAHPDQWEVIVEQYNSRYLQPALSANEIKELIKSLKKKDYQYTCQQVPLVNHCNSSVCRSRKYGVGNHAGMPVITGLTKFTSIPPIWFADIEGGGRLELSTDDLQSQLKFQKKCMDILNSMPSLMKQDAWQMMMQSLLENVTIIDAPEDATPQGQLRELIEKYCTQRAQALKKEEVRLGKPYTHRGHHTFTISGLREFLNRNNFKSFGVHELTSYIKNELQGQHNFYNISGKGTNVWVIREFNKNPELEVPKAWLEEGAM